MTSHQIGTGEEWLAASAELLEPAMVGRRGWGEDSIYFDHSGECRDPEAHRHCPGRWRGVVSLKPGPDGQRRRKKVSGKTEIRTARPSPYPQRLVLR